MSAQDLGAGISTPETTPPTAEERMVMFGLKLAAIVFTIIVVSMVGCTMHGNIYEADVKAQEVLIKAEEAKMNEATANARIEKIKAKERMIADGANPVAIRCMEEGWSRDSTGVCMAVGISNNVKEITGEF